jgi:hypothetical protein
LSVQKSNAPVERHVTFENASGGAEAVMRTPAAHHHSVF